MTVTDLSWVDALNSVRGARKVTNPNFGFQRQLQNYEHTRVKTVSLLFKRGWGVVQVGFISISFNKSPVIDLYDVLVRLNMTMRLFVVRILRIFGSNLKGYI
jgi:hypothetical protein